MAIPSTNISLSSIWGEANGGGTSSNIGLYTVSYYSYFSGPNGSGVFTDNNWGRGESSGDDKIYGVNTATTNYAIGDYSNLDYFYDQVNYMIILDATNNLAVPIVPPFTQNDIQSVDINLVDSTNTYNYISAGTGNINSGGTNVNTDVSGPTTPLLNTAYWEIIITPFAGFPASSATLTINGTPIFTGAAVSAFPTATTFDFNTYGSAIMAAITGGTGFEFVLTIF